MDAIRQNQDTHTRNMRCQNGNAKNCPSENAPLLSDKGSKNRLS